MASKPKRSIIAEINITPLTDIFLVLLIIMMVVAPMLDYKGLKLAVPSAAPAEGVEEDPNVIRVMVNEDDTYQVEEEAVTPRGLIKQLRKLKADKPDGVIIETHPESSHNALTGAMDAAQVANIEKVAVTMTSTDADPSDRF